MSAVLITGARGYLGSVLCPLLEAKHTVIQVDLGVCDATTERCMDYRALTVGDFRGIDAIVHLAAVSNDPASELDAELTRAINADGVQELCAKAKAAGVHRIVLASSASIYGKSDEPCRETSPLEPQSLYAETKIQAEHIVRTSGVGYSILRFGTLYGTSPRMRFDLALNLMVKDAITKREVAVWGGEQWRPFLHVRDAAEAVIDHLRPTHNIVQNVCLTNLRVRELAESVARVMGVGVISQPQDKDSRDYRMHSVYPVRHTDIGTAVLAVAGWVYSAMQCGVNLDDDRFYTVRAWKRYLEGQRA